MTESPVRRRRNTGPLGSPSLQQGRSGAVDRSTLRAGAPSAPGEPGRDWGAGGSADGLPGRAGVPAVRRHLPGTQPHARLFRYGLAAYAL